MRDKFDEIAVGMLPELRSCFGYRDDLGEERTAFLTVDLEDAVKVIGEALRDVQRETAEECARMADVAGNLAPKYLNDMIRERFRLKEGK
jgi:hypothetical protein